MLYIQNMTFFNAQINFNTLLIPHDMNLLSIIIIIMNLTS